MSQALLYCFSDKESRREAVLEVRNKVGEHLVNVEDNDKLMPPGIRGGIGFYRASSTGGYHLSHRPYEDVEKFIEHLGVGDHEVLRIARFEQLEQADDPTDEDPVNEVSPDDVILSYVEDAMHRANEIDADEDTAVLGQQKNGLLVETVPKKNVVSGVKSHIYGMTASGEEEFRRLDGTWIVERADLFLDGLEDNAFEMKDLYTYDCSGEVPEYIQPSELQGRDGFVVTVETKY